MTNIDLALKLRDADWFANTQIGFGAFPGTDPGRSGRELVADNLDRIAWAAAVELMKQEWNCGVDCDGEFRWVHWEHIPQLHDPDPLRATLLAAVEMESTS
jgi:hypothetical protein